MAEAANEPDYQEFQIHLIGGPSSGTNMVVHFPVSELAIPTITSKGASNEIYDRIGVTPQGRVIYEHRGELT